MDIIIGVRALAKSLGVHDNTIYRWIDKGLPYKQISEKKKAFDVAEVKEWLTKTK